MTCKDLCIVSDYDVTSEFSGEATRRAAKPHRCCECGEMISVGESHHYAAGKTDGEFWSCRTCAPCDEIRRTFCCYGWIFMMLWEEMREQVFPKWNEMTAIDCLARLTTQAAIDKVRKRYADYADND